MTNLIKSIVAGFILFFSISNSQGQPTFTFQDISTDVGSSFCMEVTAEGLNNVLGLDFSLNWDETLLDLTGVQELHPNLSGANVNTSGMDQGIVTFSFFGGPITVPDNEKVFELCFTVLAAIPNGTDIMVTSTPTSISVGYISGETFNQILTEGGTVTTSSAPIPLTLTTPDEIHSPGESFCIPVTVSNFDNLGVIQLAISWDPTILEFDNLTSFNLPFLVSGSFGTSTANQGVISMSWNVDENVSTEGVTVNNGTAIFEICFTAIGELNEMTKISFGASADPFVNLEVIEFGESENLGVVDNGGTINIQQIIFVTNNTITQPDCNDPQGGVINITVAGGAGPYTYLWSNDSTTQDIEGLLPGDYTVTITDSSMPANSYSTDFNVAGDLVTPVADAGGIQSISCTSPTTLVGGDGTSSGANLVYEWTHNNETATILNGNTSMATVNAVGVYQLMVTDTLNGCTDTDNTVVTGDVVPPIADAGTADTLNCMVTQLDLEGSVDPAGSYTYAWSSNDGGTFISGQNSLMVTIDNPGTYELLVTEDGTGCTATDTVVVAENLDTPSADAGGMKTLTCKDSVVVLDGSNSDIGANITYSWSGPGDIEDGNTTMASVNAIGTYTLTVLNTISQCSMTSTVTVNDDLSTPTAVVSDMNDEINCTNNDVVLSGVGSSTTSVTYLWTSPNGSVALNGMTLSPTVDAGGEYFLTVTNDDNGCTAVDSTTVAQDENIPIADAGPNRTLDCQTLTTQLNGSESSLGFPYAYLWTTDDGNFLTDSTGIAPMVDAGGIYTLEVTDTINNCSSTSNVMVIMDTIPPTPDPEIPAILTCEQSEVTLFRGDSSTDPNIGFSWFSPGGSIIGATPSGDPIVNDTGMYCLVLLDISTQCRDTACVEVFENLSKPTAIAGDDFALNCGQSSASLSGAGSSMGDDFVYEWIAISGNNPSGANTLSPTITSVGEYELTVTDTVNGCFAIDTVIVTQSEDYPITEAGADGVINCLESEVMLDATLVSSSGPTFIYQWESSTGTGIVSGGTTLTPIVDGAGTYTLTITNINTSCATSDSLVVITDTIPPIATSVEDSLVFDCNELTLVIDGTGSTTDDVEYLWKTLDGNILEGEDSLMATIDRGGDYTLVITNPTNGCSDSTLVFVETMEDAPDIQIAIPSNLTCISPQVILDASGSTLLPNQTFEWATNSSGNFVVGQNTLMPTVDAPAVYSFVVTDSITGCMYGGAAFVARDTSSSTALATSSGNLDCENDMVTLEASFTTTSNNFIYGWMTMDGNITTPADSQLIVQVDAAGLYQFFVRDTITGCGDTVDVEIILDSTPPMANAGVDVELPCGVNSIFLDGSVGTSNGDDFVYLWTTTEGAIIGGENTLAPEVGAIGFYILTVTDTTNNCTMTDSVEVLNSGDIVAIAQTPINFDCGQTSVTLDGTGSTTGGTITYLWTTNDGTIISGETSLMLEVSSPGTYNLLVTDTESSCTASTNVEVIFNNSFPDADAGVDQNICESTTNLSANLPTDANGVWLSLGSGVLSDPASPTSEITNLPQGINMFVWTLSTLGCPEYSSDTVRIIVGTAPQAEDDFYSMEEGEVLDFNVGNNDVSNNAQFQTLTSVGNGILVDNGLGSFTYTPDAGFVGTEEFEYELCSDDCPDICDVATVMIEVRVKDPLPLDSLLLQNTNAITPNDDGKNDTFVFDVLVQNGSDYPNAEFLVFNRWGDVVYEERPYNNNWGGTNQNGNDLPEGTYYYILRLDIASGTILKGDVTILR